MSELQSISYTLFVRFPGHRYAPPPKMEQQPFGVPTEGIVPEIIVIYDKNGYIAGLQNSVTSPDRYQWVIGNQWYQTDKVQGEGKIALLFVTSQETFVLI